MPQNIVIQVGQCGNQIGSRFWDLVLQEHAKYNTKANYNDSISTFFRNVDSKGSTITPSENQRLVNLKARSVLVDMEEGVIGQIRNSRNGGFFDDDQFVISNSGSGNNWSVGYSIYGPEYHEQILDAVRKQAEDCDVLDSFFIINSIGGGTGSGLGTYVVELLKEEFEDVYRFVSSISPSGDDHVVTSPYNSILSLSSLIDSADCVMPIENDALLYIHDRIQKGNDTRKKGSALSDNADGKRSILKHKPFDEMNSIVANLLLNMTR
ncbi:Tubulin epsilon chain [Nowakowskiella sp. JEL0407]|nr:Tubulin epsilon chain [Nowakowskiella sp. JEL0407]